jgi:ACR3 family arsenite transporter
MAERRLGLRENCLTLWVAPCVAAGTILGRFFARVADILARPEVPHISIPIAICLFAMMYPVMVQTSFENVRRSVLSPKPIALALIANWAVEPFTMAPFVWLFLSVVFGYLKTRGAGTAISGRSDTARDGAVRCHALDVELAGKG